MVAGHTIKLNGKWYKAGSNVPKDTNPGHYNFKQYSKSEIMRMSTADLQSLAKEHGIPGAEDITGGELKKILIEKFEL